MNKKHIASLLVLIAALFVVSPVFAIEPPRQNMKPDKSPRVASTTNPKMGSSTRQNYTAPNRLNALAAAKARIFTAANRMLMISNSLSLIGEKLQARIVVLQSSGKDVASLQATLSDLNAKIADAKIQASAATSSIASLVPVGGDNEIFQADKKIIADAHAKIKAGNKDLVIARKDAETIRKALVLPKFKQNIASTTPTTATTTPTGSGSTLSQ